MLPLRDRNPTTRAPVVTVLLIAVNVAVFLLVQKGGTLGVQQDTQLAFEHAAIPCELTQGHPLTTRELATERCNGDVGGREAFPDKNVVLSVLVSMFLHGGWLHLGGNMLFLWIFGNNVEDKLGAFKYLVLYVIGGAIAMGAQVALDPNSVIPVIGASGAIATIMGAYLIWFPNARVLTLFFFFFILFFELPAWLLLLAWLGMQFLTGPDSGVAWMAHVGGFAFGVLAAAFIRNTAWWRRRTRPAFPLS